MNCVGRRRTFYRAVLLFVVGMVFGVAWPTASSAADRPLSVTATVDSYSEFVAEAAQRFEIPELWIRAVMRAESDAQPRALSPKGAMGLMQIMPATWEEIRARHLLGNDPLDPHDNIIAGAAYLRQLYDRYGSPGFLAAYNAGPSRYDEHLATGNPLPAETRNYVAVLSALIADAPAATPQTDSTPSSHQWTTAPIFAGQMRARIDVGQPLPDDTTAAVGEQRPAQAPTTTKPSAEGLFVVRPTSGTGQ
ncbi:MAG: transglycosylase SLT domain-containing protein [Ancalomicrobiaceae bacterium]|nr:transglycosylase SLT domain-containing protein [Ancalomicrobiaceae bacterium]